MVPKANITFVSSSELRAVLPVSNTGNYAVSVYNSNSAGALYSSSFVVSTMPQWLTSATLANVSTGLAFSTTLSATSDSNVTYTNTSILPAGTTLLSNGYFYGTISGNTTTYSFNVKATDAENQDTIRTFSLTTVLPTFTAEYLLVGGGGSGSWAGGGGGGLLTGTTNLSQTTSYPITVGSGGAFNGTGSQGSPGTNSEFNSITVIGGGAGGAFSSTGTLRNGQPGGSGGGAGNQNGPTFNSGTRGTGTAGQGNNGGLGNSAGDAGGGGGSGAVGSNATPAAGGAGGNGAISLITGTSIYYAGGGGGNGGPPSPGGLGGGGASGSSAPPARTVAGTNGLGGGGGGGRSDGNGGSGVVILAIPTPNYPGSAPGATVTTPPAAPGKTILTFTSSGTYTA
jgi:hypothetical protein